MPWATSRRRNARKASYAKKQRDDCCQHCTFMLEMAQRPRKQISTLKETDPLVVTLRVCFGCTKHMAACIACAKTLKLLDPCVAVYRSVWATPATQAPERAIRCRLARLSTWRWLPRRARNCLLAGLTKRLAGRRGSSGTYRRVAGCRASTLLLGHLADLRRRDHRCTVIGQKSRKILGRVPWRFCSD